MSTASDYTEVTQQLYLAYFGRPADPIGLANMSAALLAAGAPTSIAGFDAAYAAGGGVKTLLDSFANSSESSALYSGDDSQFVAAIYNNVLGRDPRVEGLQFWTDALRHHAMTRGEAAVQIMAAAIKPDGNAVDAAVVGNRMVMASLFTSEVVAQNAVPNYLGPIVAEEARNLIRLYAGTGDAAALRAIIDQFLADHLSPTPMGITITLAHSPETITGGPGNDTIIAPSDAVLGDTLLAGDSIDGAGGRDIMYLTTQGAVTTGATVKNVETVYLSSDHAITAADLSGWTGLETLKITGAGDVRGVLAAATTDVLLATGHGAITLDGGHSVLARTAHGDIVIGAGQAASGDVTASNSAAGGTISVNAAGFATLVAQDGAVSITGTSNFIASAYTAVALAERSGHLAAQADALVSAAAAQDGTDAAGMAKLAADGVVGALNTLATDLANATTVSADASVALSVQHATRTALHAGAITSLQKIALDAAFGAALPTSQAAAAAAALAALAPIQQKAGIVSAAANAADASDLAATTAALNAANAVVQADADAAASAAHVVVTATSNTALASATVNGNYGASGNAITDGSAHHDTLTMVTLNNAGATTITGQAMATVSATGMTDDVTIINDKAGHGTTLKLSGVAGGTYTDDGAASVTIVAGGSVPDVLRGLHAAAAGAITISGEAGVDLGTLSAAPAAVIDASASSGHNTVSIAATQSYLGGTGADMVSTGAAAQTAAVDGGAGAADQLIVTNSANGSGAAAAMFSGFEVLQVGNGVLANLADFTHATFNAVVLGGNAEVDGLNSQQATHIALLGGDQSIVLGVSGAATNTLPDAVTLTNATAATTLLAPSLAGVEMLSLIDDQPMTITTLTGATSLNSILASGAGDLTLTTGTLALASHTAINAYLCSGAVSIDASGATGNGLQIIGGINGVNHLTGSATENNDLAGGYGADTLRGGTAADSILARGGDNTIIGGGGDDHVQAGDGDNTINLRGAGSSTVTAGNGWNVITGGDGADLIRVGTGGNLITGGRGGDIISFGQHGAGIIDGLVYASLSGTNDSGPAITANGSVSRVDIISGLHGGDSIALGQASGALSNDLGGAFTHAVAAGAASVEMVRGDFATASGQFTAAANGADTLLAWADADAGHDTAAIVLIGYAGAAASAINGAGLITLG